MALNFGIQVFYLVVQHGLVRFGILSDLWPLLLCPGLAMPKLDEYLQIADAAEYLGVCKNTLRNWGATGKLTEHRHPINNYRLYRKHDLDKLLKQITPNSDKPKKPR